MSRSKRFLAGVSITYVYQGLLIAVGLWLTPFLLRRVGQQSYGLWLVATQLLGFLTLMDFGVVTLLPRDVAYATGKAGGSIHAADLSGVVGQTARLVLYQMPLVLLAAATTYVLLPASWAEMRKPLGLVLAVFVVMFPLRLFAAILQGLQDLAFIGRMQITGWVFNTATLIALVLAGWGLYALACGWAAGQLASALLSFVRLKMRFPTVFPRRWPVLSRQTAWEQLKKCFWISMAQVAQLFMSGSDVLVIGRVIGPAAVVPYSCTGKLIAVLGNQPHLLMQVATPGLSEVRFATDRAKIAQICSALAHLMLLLGGFICCVVVLLNGWFVRWWVGPAQYGGMRLTVLLLAVMLLRHWSTSVIYTAFAFGYERRLCITNLIDGMVTIGVGAVLARPFGIIGVPIGALAGVCLVNLPSILLVVAKETETSVSTLITNLQSWFWRFAALLAVAAALARWRTPQTLWEAMVTGAGIAGLYAAVMWPFALTTPLGEYLRPHQNRLRAVLMQWIRGKARIASTQ